MRTTHEEADAVIPQQVITAIEEGATCVKFISNESVAFVLLLHFHVKQFLSTAAFPEGTGSSRNVFGIRKTAEKVVTACESCMI